MTRRGFIQALGLAIAGAIIPLPKPEYYDDGVVMGGDGLYFDDGTGFINADLIPDSSAIISLGSSAERWNKCYVLELESLESVWPTSS